LAHRREIATILGFSSGALPTAFTGRTPAEHGRWLMYRRAGLEPSPFEGFGRIAWLPPRLRRSWKFQQWLTRRVAKRVHGYFNLYEVPPHELEHFDLAEKADIFTPGGLPLDSLWDTLQRRGVRWRGWNWRTPEAQAYAELGAALREGAHDFLFLYTADLDALLHREGSRGAAVRDRMARYDAWVRELAATAGRPVWLYLCSDHGMVDVTAHADVMARVNALPHARGRDYVAFYDSTMARFWWRSGAAGEAARDAVRAALAAEPLGRWLTDDELRAEGALFEKREYGDDVFLLEPGALLVPSFMGSRPVAGMHGYDASHPDMTALLASNRELPSHVRRLADLRAFLESELDALAAEAA
ncbi:MAG: alkaline phosphatase family protein, partial [Candidatus Eisenbacteria bacterium]|nr:alkaline phosphatase family protein [Candidatus Eisenbacteria bacterium]